MMQISIRVQAPAHYIEVNTDDHVLAVMLREYAAVQEKLDAHMEQPCGTLEIAQKKYKEERTLLNHRVDQLKAALIMMLNSHIPKDHDVEEITHYE